MIIQKSQLAIKAETTEGDPIVLALADLVLCEDLNFSADVEVHERNVQRATLSRPAAVHGKRMGTITGKVAMKGSGVVATPPEFGSILQCCGMLETIVGATSVGYTPAVSPNAAGTSYTARLLRDGKYYEIVGARGNPKFTHDVAGYGYLEFSLEGAISDVDDASLIASAAYDATPPQPFLNCATAFSYDAYEALISKCEIDLGNILAGRPDPNALSGCRSVAITGRRPTFTMDPEEVVKSTYDFWAKMLEDNEGVLTWALGTVAGNIITYALPKAQIGTYSPADKDGIVGADIGGLVNMSSGDDEVSILFT